MEIIIVLTNHQILRTHIKRFVWKIASRIKIHHNIFQMINYNSVEA